MLFLLLSCAPKNAEPPEPSGATPASAELPTDPGVTIGVLDNGFRYYIEENAYPEQRAVLRLAVDAGSVLEDDDQLGLAHFVEHMAFNGTENYPENELISALERMGMDFGAHINAHTGFDETVYKLQIPTDDPELLRTGFQVLDDWAGGIAFDPEEIEKERGVVLEEWRSSRGAGSRIFEEKLPVLYHGSRYVERLPIGTEDSLQTFEHAALVRFYEDWYRPDLMALVAVGDFETEEVEALVKAHFSDLEPAADPRPRLRPEIPSHEEPLAIVVSDPEVTYASVSLGVKHDWVHENTEDAYRDLWLHNLLFSVVNERLATRAQDADAPFLGAGVGRSRLSPTEGLYSAGAGVRAEQALEGFEALLIEVRRAKLHGVTEPELARARAVMVQGLEQAWTERDNTHSSSHAAELLRVFSTNEPMPGLEWEHAYVTGQLASVSPADLQAVAQQWMGADGRIIEATLPEGVPKPTGAQLLDVVARVEAMELPPLEAEESPPLMTELPEPGAIVERGEVEELEVTTWTLSNGMRVWLKPTDFKQDEIQLSGSSPGGLALAKDDHTIAARFTASLHHMSGLGELSRIELGRALAGKQASGSASLARHFESFGGSSNLADIELMFQQIHLSFVHPRFTEDGLEQVLRQQRAFMEHRDRSPDVRFGDAWSDMVYGENPWRRPFTMEDLDDVDLTYAEQLWAERFANAGDFTVMIVGSFDLQTIESYVVRYLASLPDAGSRDSHRLGDDHPKAGVVREEMRAGLEPKARVRLMFHGPFEGEWMERNAFYAMVDTLRVRLREVMREDLGGVYGVGVSGDVSDLYGRYSIDIGYSCDPERTGELEEAMFGVIDELRAAPPEQDYVDKLKERRRREREEDVRKNSFWSSAILSTLQRGEDPLELLDYDERNAQLTATDLHQAAEGYLDLDQYAMLVMLPE